MVHKGNHLPFHALSLFSFVKLKFIYQDLWIRQIFFVEDLEG